MQVRWFYRLKPQKDREAFGLLDHYSPYKNQSIRIISKENEYGVYEYAAFEHHVALFKYLLSKDESNRIFHEVPLGSLPQKPRFDIDIKKKDLPPDTDFMRYGSVLRDRLLTNVICVLQDSGVTIRPEKNFLIYNSHKEDKYSSHVLLSGYYHANCDDALGFYEKVVMGDAELQRFVDRTVYHKGHSLRMLWCHKTGQQVVKQQEKVFRFRGQSIVHETSILTAKAKNMQLVLLKEFEESLISFISGCKALPCYAQPRREFNLPDLPESVSEEMLKALLRKIPDAPFVISGVKGNLVELTRLAESYCELCDKIHHRMTPFLLVHRGEIELRCGLAAKGKRVCLGPLSNEAQCTLSSKSYIPGLIREIEGSESIDIDIYEKKLQSYAMPEKPQSSPIPFASLPSSEVVEKPSSRKRRLLLVHDEITQFRETKLLMQELAKKK